MNEVHCALLIGGAGFVGKNLAIKLTTIGYNVAIIDIAPCPKELIKRYKCEYFCGDASEKDFLVEVMFHTQPSIVFMNASYGMSGNDMLDKKCIAINLLCASEVVKACVETNVSKLVYTSSYNVVFGGQEIINGDESLPPFPVTKHTDYYSASKYMAEDVILKANNTRLRRGGHLTTCSLRPAAIYGDSEQQHFPRLIKHIDNGLFLFRIGNAIVDWVHVDNLTMAYVCVATKLLSNPHVEQTDPVIGGQAYFISDGTPINNFEFLKPLCEARGCIYPTVILPTQILLFFAYTMEQLYLFSKRLNWKFRKQSLIFSPFLVRAEVYKVGITHYCSIQKAQIELDYKPLFSSPIGAQKMAKYYSQSLFLDNENYFRFTHIGIYILVNLAMGQLFLTGHHLIPYFIPNWLQPFHFLVSTLDSAFLYILPSRSIQAIIFYLAFLIHVAEAVYTYELASNMGCKNTKWLWTIQSVFVGYGSFRLLYMRQAFFDNKHKKIIQWSE